MEPTSILNNLVLKIGPIAVTSSVYVTWAMMLVIIGVVIALFRKSNLVSGVGQTILEGAFLAAYDAVEAVLPSHAALVFPFIATLWIFVLLANLIGLLPEIESPTSDLSVTAGLAGLVFLSVHWFGVKTQGFKNYLHHYFKPTPLMFPFHVISEISRTLALAIRLFGNMVSLQLVAFFVLMIAGFLVPIPLLMLHIIEAFIQAYIFGMLALIYIASGIQYQELKNV